MKDKTTAEERDKYKADRRTARSITYAKLSVNSFIIQLRPAIASMIGLLDKRNDEARKYLFNAIEQLDFVYSDDAVDNSYDYIYYEILTTYHRIISLANKIIDRVDVAPDGEWRTQTLKSIKTTMIQLHKFIDSFIKIEDNASHISYMDNEIEESLRGVCYGTD